MVRMTVIEQDGTQHPLPEEVGLKVWADQGLPAPLQLPARLVSITYGIGQTHGMGYSIANVELAVDVRDLIRIAQTLPTPVSPEPRRVLGHERPQDAPGSSEGSKEA